MDPEEMVSAEWLADYTKVPLATVYRWRHYGTGPTAYRIGRHLRYRRRDVDRWIEKQRLKGAA